MTDRYEPFRKIARALSIESIALVPGSNFTRLFGQDFHQNERPLTVLIPAEGKPSAVVPNLELGSFSAINFEGEVFDWKDQTGYQCAFDQFIRIIDAQQSIAALRLCKNDAEIAAMRQAILISEKALANTIDRVKVGMSERSIENILVQNLFSEGAEDFAFSPIVAASTNSANPHAHSREEYSIAIGDALLIDFGARAGGVCADITRTFFVKECTDERAEIYNTVLNANLAGLSASKAGTTAHDVDDATMKILEQSPFADRIRHKTGHGLGRDIHEDPYIMRGNDMRLEPGMVFTIEPGLQFDKTLTYIG